MKEGVQAKPVQRAAPRKDGWSALGTVGAPAEDRLASAMGNLETPPPEVSTDTAVEAAVGLFGLRAVSAQELPGERDRNFLIKTLEGEHFVIKVVHPAEDPAVSALQARLLQHLAARGVPAQTVVAPLEGNEPVLRLAASPPVSCLVRCVTYLPGERLATVMPSSARWRELGRFLSGVDLALADLDEPLANRPFLWDIKHATSLRPLVQYIGDPLRRGRVAAILDMFAAEVLPRLAALPSQVIHNDANPQNVLVADDHICGVIDFGDAVNGPVVQELGVAISYQSLGSPWPSLAAIEITRGYHEAFPLSDEELALIPALVATRLALTTVITSWRSALHPGNAAYILRNKATIDANLEVLTDLSAEREVARFVAAIHAAQPSPEEQR